MHAFGSTENAPPLFDAVQVVTDELNAEEADAACIVAEIPGDIDALEKETPRNREAIASTYTEQERRAVTVRGAGRARPQELWSGLEEAPYELAVVNSPTLILPYELMAEIFDWHMLMGGRLKNTLLVCKRWTMVAYSSPRLWSRISITNYPRRPRYLKGAILCNDLDHLRLVLSRSRSCPLQVELSFISNELLHHNKYSSGTLLMPEPQATANRIKAVKLIMDDQILKRCTGLVLANHFLPFDYQNVAVLPLLSSIRTYSLGRRDREILFIQSLVDLSPGLRHIHCSHGLSAENKGVGLWTKRIESYSWISPSSPCHPLHESPSLRKLGIRRDPVVPLTLPALQVLKWSIGTYSALHRITAPHLHTLILRHSPYGRRVDHESAGSISFPNLRVAVHNWIYHPTALHMFHTPALEHLSIKYRSSISPPIVLLELFDGSTHMPTPKSIHLDCTFTDDALIAALGHLPWLEELQVAGTAVRDTFWKRLTPSGNPSWQVSPANSHTDEGVTRILVPNLKVLLIHYPASTRRTVPALNQQSEMPQVSKHPDEISSGGDWTVMQASALAVARERTGCPLRTLACWSPEQKVDVLVGSLDSVPNRPKFVSLTALWCY
jgi:hypothetical protein